MTKTETWTLQCTCCCGGRLQEYVLDVEYPEAYVRCSGCNCRKTRVPASIAIRVYIHGIPTLQMIENLQTVARLMGANDDAILVREGDEHHYVEVPGEGITNRLEIAEITGSRPKREKAKP